MTSTTTLHRYLWVLLLAGTTASVAANVAHASPGVGPRIMAVAAPIALLAFTHLVGLWGRIRISGGTYWAILLTVALLASGAARVSFAAVRELASGYGYGPLDAALIPLMLDGGLAVTALALVVLSRIEAEAALPLDPALATGDRQLITEPDQPITESTIVPISDETAVDRHLIDTGQGASHPTGREACLALVESSEKLVDRATDQAGKRANSRDTDRELAQLISSTGRTTQPISVITQVLTARASGIGQKSAGAAVGISQGAVRQIEALKEEVALRSGAE